MKRFAIVAAVLFATLGYVVGTSSTASAMDQNTLQNDVISFTMAGATSSVARIIDHGQENAAVAGTVQYGTATPVSLDTRYRTGSVTKTFVAATVLKLVSQGKLSLSDTVDRWVPGLINANGNDGKRITVKQLLQHTSGLPDYTETDAFFNTITSAQAFESVGKDKVYTSQDLINLAMTLPPVFAPGSGWSYSNTNYVVAGLIIKAATGNAWNVEVTNQILTPLGLSNTSIPSTAPMPAPFVHAYNLWTSKPQRVYTDVTEHNPTWADAAGQIVTTTVDELKFFSALLSGQVLPPAQLAEMKSVVPAGTGLEYGLGIARSTMCGKELWWHDGVVVGYSTFAGTTVDGSVSVAYDTSTTDVTGADKSFNQAVDAAGDTLVRHGFCGPNYKGTESISAASKPLRGKSLK